MPTLAAARRKKKIYALMKFAELAAPFQQEAAALIIFRQSI